MTHPTTPSPATGGQREAVAVLESTPHSPDCVSQMSAWDKAAFDNHALLEMGECDCDRTVRAMLAFAANKSEKEGCRTCDAGGWVCENHRDLPFEHGCGGAGEPCGSCNLEMASAGYAAAASSTAPAQRAGSGEQREALEEIINRRVCSFVGEYDEDRAELIDAILASLASRPVEQRLRDVAQALQDHMEQHHGICLKASEWDVAVAAALAEPHVEDKG